MLAGELKKEYIKKDKQGYVGVIAIGKDFWYHVHDDEEIPENLTIALHPRIKAGKTKEINKGVTI